MFFSQKSIIQEIIEIGIKRKGIIDFTSHMKVPNFEMKYPALTKFRKSNVPNQRLSFCDMAHTQQL